MHFSFFCFLVFSFGMGHSFNDEGMCLDLYSKKVTCFHENERVLLDLKLK